MRTATGTRSKSVPAGKIFRRAERLIHAAEPLYVVRQTASGALETAKSYPLVLLGAGILAGFLIYNLIPKEDTARSSQHRSRRRG